MCNPKSRRLPKPIWFGVAAVLMVMLWWWFLSVWLPHHREQVAIREIERVGGSVRKIFNYGRFSWFNRVECVDFTPYNRDVMGSGLHGGRRTPFSNPKVTDSEVEHLVKHLKGLTTLDTLYLDNTKITDEGLVHLKGLTNLTYLHLGNSKITDNYLHFDNTKITDEGLVHLKGLTKLQQLCLSGTKVSDSGLVHLEGLPYLRYLELAGTKVTYKKVEQLRGRLIDVPDR